VDLGAGGVRGRRLILRLSRETANQTLNAKDAKDAKETLSVIEPRRNAWKYRATASWFNKASALFLRVLGVES
jgi:hypothetical protein